MKNKSGMRLKALVLMAIMVSSLMVGASIGHQKRVEAVVPPIIDGGISIITAFCNIGFVITVGPPVAGVFKIDPGFTDIYQYGIFENAWNLGGASPGAECCVGYVCTPVPALMLLTGTSL